MINTEQLVAKARKANKERDAMDNENGHLAPAQASLTEIIRVAKAALWCGMTSENWNDVAESYALLEEAQNKLQP
jgi:cell division protein FtsL